MTKVRTAAKLQLSVFQGIFYKDMTDVQTIPIYVLIPGALKRGITVFVHYARNLKSIMY